MLKEHNWLHSGRAVSIRVVQPGGGDRLQGSPQHWERRCLWLFSSIWKERHQALALAGNSGAGTGSELSACPFWLAAEGRWRQGTENSLTQLQLSSCLPPATDLSAAVLIGSVGRCSWGFLPRKALLVPHQPLRLGHHPPHQPLAWHGTARRAAVPQGVRRSQPGPGLAGFIALGGVGLLPSAGFP